MLNRVVVTSVGIISPIGLTAKTTWDNLLKGNSGIDQISTFDTNNFETTIAAEVKNFDPIEYFGKKESRRMDRFVQLAGVSTLEAMEDSQVNINSDNATRISVMIASGIGGIITLSEQNEVLFDKGPSRISPFLVPMMLPDMASGQISMMIGAKGPNYSVVSACASSGDTIGLAYEAIKSGGSFPVVLNVANDMLVEGFLNDRLQYLDIPNFIQDALNEHEFIQNLTLDDINYLTNWTKKYIKEKINAN